MIKVTQVNSVNKVMLDQPNGTNPILGKLSGNLLDGVLDRDHVQPRENSLVLAHSISVLRNRRKHSPRPAPSFKANVFAKRRAGRCAFICLVVRRCHVIVNHDCSLARTYSKTRVMRASTV